MIGVFGILVVLLEDLLVLLAKLLVVLAAVSRRRPRDIMDNLTSGMFVVGALDC